MVTATGATNTVESQDPRDDYYGYFGIWDVPRGQDGAKTAFSKEIGDKGPVLLTSTAIAAPEQQDGMTRVFLLELSHIMRRQVGNTATVRIPADNGTWLLDGNDANTTPRTSIVPNKRFPNDKEFLEPKVYTPSFMSSRSGDTGRGLLWYRLITFEPLSTGELSFWGKETPFFRRECIICLSANDGKSSRFLRPESGAADDEPGLRFRRNFKAGSFAAMLRGLHDAYRPFSEALDWKLFISLQCHHANLLSYSKFVVLYEETYMSEDQPLLDPRSSDFKPGHLKRFTTNSCNLQQIAREGDRIITAIEHLVDEARANSTSCSPESPQTKEQSKFAVLEQEILGHCAETKGCLLRLSNSLEHDLRLLGLHRDMKQTDSVQQLTILATVFLPLSLAAGVLSMQTRFNELGVLLYDFFGVTVLLVALILPFMLLLHRINYFNNEVLPRWDMKVKKRIMSKSKSKKWVHVYRMLDSAYKYLRKCVSILLWVGVAPELILILVSFNIGMFNDITLGAEILGYGTAVLGAFAIPFLCVFLVVQWLLKRWETRRQTRQTVRENQEENVTGG